EDPREEFTVAVIAGNNSDEAQQNEYLIEKLSDHIIRSVDSLEFHEYSPDELQRYA
ncbi:MAG: hypothetical protein GWO23_21305, partial [Gammaproteobacteria bacterium]|nr:hypothetical protein [Gammaproteobacteria bacterium]